MSTIYDFEARTIDGQTRSMADYRGQVLLVVNVASQCGFTPQYTGLEALYRKYQAHGLVVLGFPCDQFGNQEPGDEAEIKQFCSTKYSVTFPLFAKVKVNGPEEHPLFHFLKDARRGFLGTRSIKWNFTKFLVDRHGHVLYRFSPAAPIQKIEQHVAPLCGMLPQDALS